MKIDISRVWSDTTIFISAVREEPLGKVKYNLFLSDEEFAQLFEAMYEYQLYGE